MSGLDDIFTPKQLYDSVPHALSDIFAAARGLQAASAERSGELATRAGDPSLSAPDRAFSKAGSLFYGAAPLLGTMPLVGEIKPGIGAFRSGLAGDVGRAASDLRA